ncbi:MAG: hypothetical protein ACKOBD_13045 [Chloroflexota bacterium]
MKKTLVLIPLFISLLACLPQPVQNTATEAPATVTEALPTHTPISPTPTLPPSPTPAPVITVPSAEQVIYYYFVVPKETTFPAGSIVIMPEAYILAPTLSDAALAPEAATNLRSAVEAALNDSRNGWLSDKLEVVNVAINNGHADVVLQGEYFGVGDVTLIAASQQILLTVFANANVQTATITLNGDTIGNMGISISLNAKPADYAFTRAEVEAYMVEHMNVSP